MLCTVCVSAAFVPPPFPSSFPPRGERRKGKERQSTLLVTINFPVDYQSTRGPSPPPTESRTVSIQRPLYRKKEKTKTKKQTTATYGNVEQLDRLEATRRSNNVHPSGDLEHHSPLPRSLLFIDSYRRFVVFRRLCDDLEPPPPAADTKAAAASNNKIAQATHAISFRRHRSMFPSHRMCCSTRLCSRSPPPLVLPIALSRWSRLRH